MEYEAVLVSSKVNTCIYGYQTESRFKSCTKNLEETSFNYNTKDYQHISVPCYRESISTTTAYVKIAKCTVISEGTTNFVKGRVEGFRKLKGEAFFHDLDEIGNLDVVNIKFDSVGGW